MNMKYFPLAIAIKSFTLLITARIHFKSESVGQKIFVNNQDYTIFRHALLRNPQEPQGIFCVWFGTKMSPSKTKILSTFTMIAFIGFPGWTSKKWLVNDKTGDFGGIYEFDTVENAKKYQNSYAMKFSKWRSKEGNFRTEVFDRQKFPYQNILGN